MDHSRESLKDFIASNSAVPDTATAIMRNLEPLYIHADAGRYRLTQGNDLGLELIASAITTATGHQAATITLSLMSRLGHLTLSDETAFWRRLTEGRGDSLGDCLRQEHRTSLQHGLMRGREHQVGLAQRLWERLENDLWLALDKAVAGIVCDMAPAKALASIADSIRSVIYYFVGFAITGDKQRLAQMSALMELIPRAIPLHSNQHDPHRWHVLAY